MSQPTPAAVGPVPPVSRSAATAPQRPRLPDLHPPDRRPHLVAPWPASATFHRIAALHLHPLHPLHFTSTIRPSPHRNAPIPPMRRQRHTATTPPLHRHRIARRLSRAVALAHSAPRPTRRGPRPPASSPSRRRVGVLRTAHRGCVSLSAGASGGPAAVVRTRALRHPRPRRQRRGDKLC